MSERTPPFKEMTFLRLNEGPGDGVEMEIAPTMTNLMYAGEKYFRMPNSFALRDELLGGSYLWDRYYDKDQVALRKQARADAKTEP